MLPRRRFLSALPLLLAVPASAHAEEAAKKEAGQAVDLLPVGMPVVVGGRLVNYVFVNVRILLTPGADVSRWRAKEPYFRDALVRAGHETPFVTPGDYEKIDAAKLGAALMRQAQAITGPGVVRGVVVLSQTPSHGAHAPHG
jgi:hypothetical protein